MRTFAVLMLSLLLAGCGTAEYKNMSGPVGIGPRLKTRLGCTLQPNEKEKTIRIAALEPGGGAEKAGLQVGDQFLKVDGSPIAVATDIHAVLNRKNPGDTIPVEVERAGKTLTCQVVLMPPVPVDRLPPDQ